MNVLLVEPYYTGSHRAWADGFKSASEHEVMVLSLPGETWRWRMRGGAVTLAERLEQLGGWAPDVVLASSMFDVAHFRALAHPFIGHPPTVVYFHESQLTYPERRGTSADPAHAMTNWVSACAADLVAFNSRFHRNAFFSALPDFLGRYPEPSHAHLVEQVEARSIVLPVGVDLSGLDVSHRGDTPPRILWNHRWDYDKAPHAFASAIESLVTADIEFELALAGWRPPGENAALARIHRVADDRVVFDGCAPLDRYRRLLAESHVVVSSAMQENFGVSVVEATAAGCRPVLPNRLSYPEIVPAAYHHEVLYEEGTLAAALEKAVSEPESPEGLSESMRRFEWSVVAPEYDRVLSRIG